MKEEDEEKCNIEGNRKRNKRKRIKKMEMV